MRIEVEDLYIDCDEIIQKANELYSQVIRKDISNADLEYIDSMNRYINNYTKYREKIIKNYIDDLQGMINYPQ
jgi:hypothetical protein